MDKNKVSTKKKKYSMEDINYPKWIYFLFSIFVAYMAVPLVDVPLLGLSLSAPIFFFIALYVIFKTPKELFRPYKNWVILAIFIWLGTFLSAILNGLLSGGVNINSSGYLSIIRTAYWLVLLIITIIFSSQHKVIKKVVYILGFMSLILGLLRWLEVILFGALGASGNTKWMSQNGYGFLFSTFSPFLMVFVLKYTRWKRFFSGISLIALWSAVAINGSRGSWVAISVGVLVLLILLFTTKVKKFIGVFVGLSILVVAAVLILAAIPQLTNTIVNRYDTFDQLSEDKSFVIRQLMNQKALRLFSNSPIIGVGPSRFRATSIELDIPSILGYQDQSYFDTKSAHNSYLAYLAETGLFGFIPFVVLLIILIFRGFTNTKYFLSKSQFWALAIYLSFIQTSIHMWVITALNNSGTWFIYGLTGAIIMLGQSEEQKMEIQI